MRLLSKDVPSNFWKRRSQPTVNADIQHKTLIKLFVLINEFSTFPTLFGTLYTREDSERIQQWLVARQAGKPARKDWAYAIAEQGGNSPYKFGKWTNYVYKGAGSTAGDTLERADRLKAYRHPTALCDRLV